MKIVILFLLFLILWPVVRAVIGMWRLRRAWQEQMRQAGDAMRGRRGQGGNAARGTRGDVRNKRKVFDRSDGEYVEYEEISLTVEEAAIREERERNASSSHGDARADEQVSDAEWTDIK